MKIIYFGAFWCPSCLIMRPIWEKIATKFNYQLIEYDYDINETEAKKYGVKDILPECIIVNEKEEEVLRVLGEKNENQIINMIEEV